MRPSSPAPGTPSVRRCARRSTSGCSRPTPSTRSSISTGRSAIPTTRPGCCRSTIAATTSTRATWATARWATRSICRCSSNGMGGPDMAPQPPQPSGRPGEAVPALGIPPATRRDVALRSSARGQGRHEAAADQGLALLVDGLELALDELLGAQLEHARHPAPADDVVARPGARGEAHLVAAHVGPAREGRHHAAQDTRVEHAHGEHGRIARRLGEGLVVVDRVEVAGRARVLHEVGPRELLHPYLRQRVPFLHVFPVAGRLQERHGRHDAAGLARGVRLVEVEWVVVLDGAGELPDLPALHVHRHGLALPADEALVDRHGYLPVSHWFSNGTMIPDPATTAGTSYPLGADQERPPGGDSPSTGGWIAKGRDST